MAVFLIVFLFVFRLFSYKQLQEKPEISNDTDTSTSLTRLANSSMQKRAMEENFILKRFRENVNDALYKDYMKSDVYLMRWLKVTDYNLEKAEFMLRKALKWRLDNKIDTIVDEVLIEQKQSPFIFIGQDYEGSAVVLIRTMLWDVRGHVLAGKRDVAVRWVTQFFENIELSVLRNAGTIGKQTRKGAATDKATYIVDAYAYSLKQHGCLECFNVYLELMRIHENYYPGYMKHFLFINASKLIKTPLELLKPLMARGTRDVVKVLGNKTEWERIISKIICHLNSFALLTSLPA